MICMDQELINCMDQVNKISEVSNHTGNIREASLGGE